MVEPFTLNTNPVFAELAGGSIDERRAAFADPDWRARVREAWKAPRMLVPRWDTMEVMMSGANPELVGRRVPELADEAGLDPFDMLMELTLAEPDLMLRIKVVLANDDVDGITKLLQDEHTTLGLSDAGAHVGQLCDAPQATDLLGNWVRDRGVMPMETAIRKLTGQQADLMSFEDRGYLRPGYWADITVFDPATIDPGPIRRVRDFPADAERLTADEPVGIRHVLVNGVPIQRDGVPVEQARSSLPGQLVRPAPRS
jgi:N-acyl-D-aspartate/D-glutamate deacylase